MTTKKLIRLALGLTIVSASLTIMFLTMRALMNVGGYCAEGGPNVIAQRCPEGVGALMPLSILALFVGVVLYAVGFVKGGPNYMGLFWSALFLSLGWNFLEFGIDPPGNADGPAVGWLVCAGFFALLGSPPLFAAGPKGIFRMFVGWPKGELPAEMEAAQANARARLEARRALRTQLRSIGNQVLEAKSASRSLVEDLERLSQLHKSGALSDEEFKQAKDELLSKGGK